MPDSEHGKKEKDLENLHESFTVFLILQLQNRKHQAWLLGLQLNVELHQVCPVTLRHGVEDVGT